MGILLISPDVQLNFLTQKAFTVQGLHCDSSHSSEEAQLKAYHHKYNWFVLDLETQNQAVIEVVKFLRTNFKQSKILATISSPQKLDALMINEHQLMELGVTKLLTGPTSEGIVREVLSTGETKSTKIISTEAHNLNSESHEQIIDDADFSQMKNADFDESSVAVYDYYLKLGCNRFIKVIHSGEKIDKNQLKKYSNGESNFLYFNHKDRFTFIHSTNKSTDNYFEEIFLLGIQPDLIAKGKTICKSIHETALQDEGLKKFINDLELFNPVAFSHAFLVSFFSILISKDLDWVGPKSIQTLALGALFHDIGITQLPPDLQHMEKELMNDEQKLIYNRHPLHGSEMLESIPGINPGVIQIVLQHHEYMDRSGYPHRLPGDKIFPLAKVVALADGFSSFLNQKEMSPIKGLKLFLKDIENIQRYDPALIKNLIIALK